LRRGKKEGVGVGHLEKESEENKPQFWGNSDIRGKKSRT